jgi:hypothetical protein
MKKLIGFGLICLGVGMFLMLLVPKYIGFLLSVLFIFIGYKLFSC